MSKKPTYEELEQRVKELEEFVQKSEVSYREIFDFATDMIVIQDINTGEILEVNDETTRMTGFTSDEMKQRGVSGFSRKSDKFSPEKATEYMMKAARGEPQLFEWGFIDKSGKFHPTEVHIKKVLIEGQPRLLGIVRDISKRKQMEESLQESEIKHKTLVNNIPGMIYRAYPDWSTEVISGSEALCGYTEQELNAKEENWLSIIHPDDTERVFKEGSELAKRQQNLVQTYRIITKEGNIHWIEDRKTSFFSEEGEFKGIDGIVFDVTSRKKVEAALRESEEKYKLLANNSADVIYKISLENEKITYASPSIERMMGYTVEEALFLTARDVVTAESYALQQGKLMQALAGTRRTPEIMELEAMHKDGHAVPVEIHASLVYDEQENPVEIMGAVRDITERKRAEEEIRKLARTDPLTGTNNRRSFMELAESEWTRSRRYNHSLSILMIDIDHFKSINDTYGHHLGDLTLQLLADTCLGVLRKSDIFGRIGGEEFAAALVETNGKRGINVAERLRKNLSELTIKEGSISFNFSISIGVANLNDADESVEDTIKRADKALYKAKNLGRNKVASASDAF